MVRAILDGRKTQTRRVIKPQPIKSKPKKAIIQPGGVFFPDSYYWDEDHPEIGEFVKCPYGQPGDRLWVRETWWPICADAKDIKDLVRYKADGYSEGRFPWKPSIHMPRWASRITLKVINIRVERLQDISWQDCEKEGQTSCYCNDEPRYKNSLISNWIRLWNSINEKRGLGWDKNPWVWVMEWPPILEEE